MNVKTLAGITRLSMRQKQVLLFLAHQGPKSKYEVANEENNQDRENKEKKIRYPVVHLSMRALEKKGLVMLVGKKVGQKGVQTLIYDLTQKGLFFLAATEKDFDFSCYAKSHEDVDPIFFNMWNSVDTDVQKAIEKTFRFLSGMAITEVKDRKKASAGRSYLEYLAGDGGALTLKDLGDVIGVQNMDRYFAVMVQHEGLYRPLVDGVQMSLDEYSRRVREKTLFLQMLRELRGFVEEARSSGVQEHEIESRLMKLAGEKLQKIMAPYLTSA